MAKRASLFSRPVAVPDPEPEAAVAPPAAAEAQARKYPVAKTREGKRVATVYLEPEALRQLKRIGFEEERTVQDLLLEGVNAVFEKRGMSRIG